MNFGGLYLSVVYQYFIWREYRVVIHIGKFASADE